MAQMKHPIKNDQPSVHLVNDHWHDASVDASLSAPSCSGAPSTTTSFHVGSLQLELPGGHHKQPLPWQSAGLRCRSRGSCSYISGELQSCQKNLTECFFFLGLWVSHLQEFGGRNGNKSAKVKRDGELSMWQWRSHASSRGTRALSRQQSQHKLALLLFEFKTPGV